MYALYMITGSELRRRGGIIDIIVSVCMRMRGPRKYSDGHYVENEMT